MLDNKKEVKTLKHVCCICGKPFEGYGNNPDPVKNEGRCCNECNSKIVIPRRIDEMINEMLEGWDTEDKK